MTTPNNRQTAKWSGACLAGGALIFIITIVIYIAVLGQPDGTGVNGAITSGDAAAHILTHWGIAKLLWLAETAAIVLLAIAGFGLQHRSYDGTAAIPSALAWIALSVGAVVNAVMYAIVLGAYPTATAAVADHPALFESLRGAAYILFYIGNTVMYLGLAGAFFSESSNKNAVLSKWLALPGCAVCLVCSLAMAALLAGYGSLMIAAPFGLLGFALAGLFGLRIAVKN